MAHVDHGIQKDSDGVAERVIRMAEGLGLRLFKQSLQLGPGASETRARAARYDALNRMRRQSGARYLVTAHHADDQIETAFLRFLSGSGLAGLSGIAGRNDDDVVRPLLPFRKAELMAWARDDVLTSRLLHDVHDDPGNYDAAHDRSWLRHSVLPGVRQRFGRQVDDAILRVVLHSRNERAAWSAVLSALPDLSFMRSGSGVQVARSTLEGYDPRLSIVLLCAAAREAGCLLGPERAQRVWPRIMAAPSGRTFQLGKGWVIESAFDRLWIRRSPATETELPRATAVRWGGSGGGRATFGVWSVSWTHEAAENVGRAGMTTWVTLGGGIIRSPKAGERAFPMGGIGRRKVTRLLMEGRVPRSERPDYPVLTRGDQILWLPGICRMESDVPRPGEAALRLDAQFDGR